MSQSDQLRTLALRPRLQLRGHNKERKISAPYLSEIDVSTETRGQRDGSFALLNCNIRVCRMGSFARPKREKPSNVQRAPWFVATLKGCDHAFEFVNDSYTSTFGARGYEGRTVHELFPEVRGQAYPAMLDEVFNTGRRISLTGSPIWIQSEGEGPLVERVVDFNYIPTMGTSGSINGIYCEGFISSPNPMDVLTTRASDAGLKGFTDTELLALLVYQQSHDVAALTTAHQLIDRFRCLSGVLMASRSDLEHIAPAQASDGLRSLKSSTALHFKLIRELSRRMLRQKMGRRPLLASSVLVRTFLAASLRHEPREEFHVLFLDHGNGLIADEVLGRGSITRVAVYSREVMRRALELSATALILVHNHPSGSRQISADDRAITLEIVRAGQTLGIEVHDHLIVAGDDIISFRAEGLLK
jgi:DNA repair protein RadC